MSDNTIDNDRTVAIGGTGTVLVGRYRIVKQLGQGGMGSVWLAEDVQLDSKQFAIKMLPSILVANKRAYAQLKSEALVSMKLTHPNIVTLRAFEENNGNPFLVMDYIDGQPLDEYIEEHADSAGRGGHATQSCQGLPEADVLRILKPIAEALDYAHGEGVVHRDVKPANVMIRKDGHPFILDFGIAREVQETMTRVTGRLTSGTLLYMSPEQLNGEKPKAAHDVYSFAAMAYECLKGEPPFVRGVIEHQIVNVPPPPLPEGIAIAPGVMAGLAKTAEARPATCAAVLDSSYSAFTRPKARMTAAISRPAVKISSAGPMPHATGRPPASVQGGVGGRVRMGGAVKAVAAAALVAVMCGVFFALWSRRSRNDTPYWAGAKAHIAETKPVEKERQPKAEPVVAGRPSHRQAALEVEKIDKTMRGEPNAPRRLRGATKEDVGDIYATARVQIGNVGEISQDSDGFDVLKRGCREAFNRAKAEYDAGHWPEAASLFTNAVRQCRDALRLNNEWYDMRQSFETAKRSAMRAKESGADRYSETRWAEATDLMKRGGSETAVRAFVTARRTFDEAARRFSVCADEANAVRKVAERVEKVRAAAMGVRRSVAMISDADGFKSRKDSLADVLNRAEMFYGDGSKRWDDAIPQYERYIAQGNALIAKDGERQRAVAARSEGQRSFHDAEAAGAKVHAIASWNDAVKTWRIADAEFGRMDFAAAETTFKRVAQEFQACANLARNSGRYQGVYAERSSLEDIRRLNDGNAASRDWEKRQREQGRQSGGSGASNVPWGAIAAGVLQGIGTAARFIR